MSRGHKSYRAHVDNGSLKDTHVSGDSDLYPVEEIKRETCGVCANMQKPGTIESLELNKASFWICSDCRRAIEEFINIRRQSKGYYRILYQRLVKIEKIDDPLGGNKE